MKSLRAYVDLMKLRVVELLIITTLPAMVLAEKGLPSFGLVAATLIGGTLAAGASNAFNMVIEADTDKLMARTSKRPLVTGSVTRTQAIIFACILTVLSLLIFEIFTTELATLLTALAIFYYVVIYTIILKPNTSQNIVWGGAAGCMPVLIGWAAVTGSLTLVPVAFFWWSSSGRHRIFGPWQLNIKMIIRRQEFLCCLRFQHNQTSLTRCGFTPLPWSSLLQR